MKKFGLVGGAVVVALALMLIASLGGGAIGLAAEMPMPPPDRGNLSEGGEETRYIVASGIPLGESFVESGTVLLLHEDGKWVAQDAPDTINLRELGIRSLAEFEALFPPNPDGEFIVHDVPPLPVVIDGVRYEPEDIHLFNGQVLRFVLDKDILREEGVIYAFTTPEGWQRFVEDRWGVRFFVDRPEEVMGASWTVLYEHWHLGGKGLVITHGYGYPHLGAFDNITSSAATGPGLVVLYDGHFFTGNSVTLNPQRTYAFLWWFNDRASSVIAQ